jgi:hypothetical protein
LIVNHMSSGSPQFEDFRKSGDASRYADLFLTYGRVFRKAQPKKTSSDLSNTSESSIHGCEVRRRHRTSALDDVHVSADRYQCLFGFGPRLSRSDPEAVSRGWRARDPAGCRGIRDQKSGTSCFMIPETFRIYLGYYRAGACAGHSKFLLKCTGFTKIRFNSPAGWIGFMTSRFLRWSCMRCTRMMRSL